MTEEQLTGIVWLAAFAILLYVLSYDPLAHNIPDDVSPPEEGP